MYTPLITLLISLALGPLAAHAAVTIPNPIEADSLPELFVGVIRVFLGAVAVFATFIFVYGGFLMLSSGGNPDQVKKAKDTLFWATMGIITVLGSWVFIKFVLEAIITSTG